MTADESPHQPLDNDASPATVARWRSLRDAVVSELRAVGLPVGTAWNGVAESEEPRAGVLVDVNTAADGGGIQISWHQPVERLTPLAEALEAGELTESMMLRYGQAADVLTKAAALVLGIAGYALAPSMGPYSTVEYDVLHGPRAIELDNCRQ
ncbi:hypothetical protein ABZ754_10380 [Micromonospora purpureochromogenes]|uniref:hypothetical protein n=1 Tax=Micromonospora purpureochromogenes TaxID=47872 RepID=UPI0034001328